jgi:transposase
MAGACGPTAQRAGDAVRGGRARHCLAPAAWHLRVGGSWRALPGTLPAWRTVYGWVRKWLDLGLFDRLLGDVARRRRRAMGRRAKPRLSLIDPQAVKCIPVRGPRGDDAAKKTLPRRGSGASAGPWLMPMAPGWPSRSSPPQARTVTRSKLLMRVRRRGPACGRRSWRGPLPLHPVTRGRTGTGCAIVWSSATPLRKASSCSRAAGLSSAASAGSCPGAGCCGIALAVWTAPPRASRAPPPCPASRLCSTPCLPKPPQVKPTQTGS